MANIALRLSGNTAEGLSSAYLHGEPEDISFIELKILLDDNNLNVREFAAFLSAIDGVFGRVSQLSFIRYSHSPYSQIKISEVRQGSTELVFIELISRVVEATPYIVLLLFVKYLGGGGKSLSESTKNFADSYKSLQEGKLARLNRKKIIDDMEKDEVLKDLTSSQRRQLLNLLAELEMAERKRIPAARRFVRKYLKDVTISRKKRDGN